MRFVHFTIDIMSIIAGIVVDITETHRHIKLLRITNQTSIVVINVVVEILDSRVVMADILIVRIMTLEISTRGEFYGLVNSQTTATNGRNLDLVLFKRPQKYVTLILGVAVCVCNNTICSYLRLGVGYVIISCTKSPLTLMSLLFYHGTSLVIC